MAKSKTSKPSAAFRPQVHIRMYQQGLGDCFLLRFETERNTYFDALIDCGIYKASPDAGAIMNRVVDDIVASTKDAAHPQGHLDLLIVTHEHWDHISGFAQALPKFEKMAIDEVWQAWTEDESEPVAAELMEKYHRVKAKLVRAMRGLAERPGVGATALNEAFEVMSFFGVDKAGDEEGSYAKIKGMLGRKKSLRYLSPQDVEPLGDTGVKAFVLGPPKDSAMIAKDDPGAKDGYHKEKLALFTGLETMIGAVEAQLLSEGENEVDRGDHPFGKRHEVPVELARQTEYFQTVYGFEGEDGHPEAFRSIDDLPAEALGQLALRLDSHLNNTSLVLAFQLPGGDVLLFPGDAQGGNWKSWADLEHPLAFKREKTDAHELLAKTVFYKVSHHGSHNATPKTFGLELMTNPKLRAAVPVDHIVAQTAKYGEMPLGEIMSALGQRTRKNVVRSDDTAPNSGGDFRYSPTILDVVRKKGSTPVPRPLWCETSYDLGK